MVCTGSYTVNVNVRRFCFCACAFSLLSQLKNLSPEDRANLLAALNLPGSAKAAAAKDQQNQEKPEWLQMNDAWWRQSVKKFEKLIKRFNVPKDDFKHWDSRHDINQASGHYTAFSSFMYRVVGETTDDPLTKVDGDGKEVKWVPLPVETPPSWGDRRYGFDYFTGKHGGSRLIWTIKDAQLRWPIRADVLLARIHLNWRNRRKTYLQRGTLTSRLKCTKSSPQADADGDHEQVLRFMTRTRDTPTNYKTCY